VRRRPGSGGITYFTPMQYLKPGEAPTEYQPPAPVANPPLNQNPTSILNDGNGYGTGNKFNDVLMDVPLGVQAKNVQIPEQYNMAAGGIASLGGYSDGGQLLRGPGDGVSDSIPATIGNRQPARLADGEFVVPARIVSELGNGSTEAGARKLYEMMDRIKASRAKAKNIAADTKAYKHLPA
jgi:hypothetical protein